MPGDQPGGAHQHVRLLDVAVHRLGAQPRRQGGGAAHPARGRRRVVIAEVPPGLGQGPLHPADELRVFQVPRRGDHQAIRGVVAVVVLGHGVSGHRADLLRGAADGPAQRVLAHDLPGEPLEGRVHRVVLVHGQLLQDHPALLLHLPRIQNGGGRHVRDDLRSHRRVLAEHVGVVAGVLLGGQGVGLPAHRVEGLGDVQGGAGAGALEQQVLQEVRGAEHAGALVPGADAHPVAHRDAALTGHPLGDHPDPAGQHGAANLVAALSGPDEAAGAVRALVAQRGGVKGQIEGHGRGSSRWWGGDGAGCGRATAPGRGAGSARGPGPVPAGGRATARRLPARPHPGRPGPGRACRGHRPW